MRGNTLRQLLRRALLSSPLAFSASCTCPANTNLCGPACTSGCTIPYSTPLTAVASLPTTCPGTDGGSCLPWTVDGGTYVGDCATLCAHIADCAIDCCDFEPLSDGGWGVACRFSGGCAGRRPVSLKAVLRNAVLAAPFVGASACCFSPIGDYDGGFDAGGDAGLDAGQDAGPDAGLLACDPNGFPGPIATLPIPDGGLTEDCLPYCQAHVAGVLDCTVSPLGGEPGTICCCCFQGSCCATGRRPASWRAAGQGVAPRALGTHFAQLARLEAASVPAFRILRRELADHRAPARLLRAAERALTDEVRHTRLTAALARRYGAVPLRPQLTAEPPTRTLEELALENAVEGCVRESYGVIVAAAEARRSPDPVVRAAMAHIAADEQHHSDLAWAVNDWLEPRLTPAARTRVAVAALEASAELRLG